MTTDPHRPGGVARGYSWKPFEPGHEITLRHGAWSDRKVRPIADELHRHLVTIAPWAAAEPFAGTVASWAHAEAQAQLLRAYLDDHGMFDDEGEELGAVRTLDRIEGRLAKLRDQLGLSPASLGKLMASAASVATATGDQASVDALAAEGSKILASRLTTTTHEADTDTDTDDSNEDQP